MKQVTKLSNRLLITGFVTALFACAIAGCNQSEAVQSESYKKLPPGEGERRLKETLKRRAAGKAIAAPPPANVRVGE